MTRRYVVTDVNLLRILAGRIATHERGLDVDGLIAELTTGEPMAGVLAELASERVRQTAKHGDQAHLPDGTGPEVQWLGAGDLDAYELTDMFRDQTKARSQNEGGDGSITFLDILLEEVAEAFAEDDPAKLRAELVQVAAVAVQWVEAIDRRRVTA